MAVKTKAKVHSDDALVYDAISILSFPSVTAGVSQVNTAVQAQLALPVSCKIIAVTVTGGTATAGVTSFNIVMGVGAEGVLAAADTSDSFIITSAGGVSGGAPSTLAANGAILFSPDQAVTLVANVPQTFFLPGAVLVGAAYVGGFDVIWPQNALLTLRTVTTGAGAGPLLVQLLIKPYDIKPYSPRGTTFLPANDVA